MDSLDFLLAAFLLVLTPQPASGVTPASARPHSVPPANKSSKTSLDQAARDRLRMQGRSALLTEKEVHGTAKKRGLMDDKTGNYVHKKGSVSIDKGYTDDGGHVIPRSRRLSTEDGYSLTKTDALKDAKREEASLRARAQEREMAKLDAAYAANKKKEAQREIARAAARPKRPISARAIAAFAKTPRAH